MFKQLRKSVPKEHSWAEVVTDATAEIARAERRIKTLRRVIINAQIKVDAGEAFPISDGEPKVHP